MTIQHRGNRGYRFLTVPELHEAARLRNTYPKLSWYAISVIMGEKHDAWNAPNTWKNTIDKLGIPVEKRPRGHAYTRKGKAS